MATWKIAPALATGNCIVMKPAEQTPASILYLIEKIKDVVPAGVLNIVNGLGEEAGAALTANERIKKIAFTGSTPVGKMINKSTAERIIPVTLELGGKSPSIFFKDIMDEDDDFLEKCVEGFTMFALNQGEVCTCPSRALIHEDIAEDFLKLAIERVKAIKIGNPLDTETMMGAGSVSRWKRLSPTWRLAQQKVQKRLSVVASTRLMAWKTATTLSQPSSAVAMTCRSSAMRSGPVLAVATFKDYDEAIKIANDTNLVLVAVSGPAAKHRIPCRP